MCDNMIQHRHHIMLRAKRGTSYILKKYFSMGHRISQFYPLIVFITVNLKPIVLEKNLL